MFKYYFLTKGYGVGDKKLLSFDRALISAKIGNFNLVKVSSILPPGVKRSRKIHLPFSSILHIAYGYLISDKKGETISAVCGVAIPQKEEEIGLIMEWSSYGEKFKGIEEVKSMLEKSMSDRNIKIKKIEIVSIEKKVKEYTCVFAGCAIF
ncbi:MAG: arginine decarboxylase, pyruvoyl-dependent [Candidatus Hydrothermales bacterium]